MPALIVINVFGILGGGLLLLGIQGLIRRKVYSQILISTGNAKLRTGFMAIYLSLCDIAIAALAMLPVYLSGVLPEFIVDLIVGLILGYVFDFYIQKPAIEKAVIGRGEVKQ